MSKYYTAIQSGFGVGYINKTYSSKLKLLYTIIKLLIKNEFVEFAIRKDHGWVDVYEFNNIPQE